jgi:hypothetical protein
MVENGSKTDQRVAVGVAVHSQATRNRPDRQANRESVTGMNDSISSIRWLRVLGAAVAVVASSFLILMVIVMVYAFVLALQARGVPDQTVVNHFAARVSPMLMPWLEVLLAFVLALVVARRVEKAALIHGLLIGLLAGLLSVAVRLLFGGRLGLRDLVFILSVAGLGWLGSFFGQGRMGRT